MRIVSLGLVLLYTCLARLNAANYFVDYNGGDDANAGTSTAAPWRHCPGDPAASGAPAAVSLFPGDTVFFKGGVTYVLTGATGIALKWDGAAGNSVVYDGNSAGTWGTGRAKLTDNYGGNAITAFSSGETRRHVAFKFLEFASIGGSAKMPADTGSPAAARFGGGIAFHGGAENVLIEGCVFRELGYWFNQKPMSAASLNGVGISSNGCRGLKISNCEFSRMATACDVSRSAEVAGFEVVNSSFRDAIVWPFNLPAGLNGLAPGAISVLGSLFGNDGFLSANYWNGYGADPTTEVAVVASGSTVTFAASALASPAASFQWRKDGAEIPGATAATLRLTGISSADAGTYTVIATNPEGSSLSNSAVVILGSAATVPENPPPTAIAPAITAQPVSQLAALFGVVSFSVQATGTPAPTYQWFKNGVPIVGATAATLTLTNLAQADAADYTVVVSNAAGSVVSEKALLTTQPPPPLTKDLPPAIMAQPTSQVAATLGSVTFSAAGSGMPAPSYQWYRNGIALAGATESTLTLHGITAGDAGDYVLVATNPLGSATSNPATLTVNAPPTIFTQPVSHTVAEGSGLTLTVSADGTPPPSYQWLKDGVAIAGATSALLDFPNITSSDAGRYSVIVSSAGGSVVSSEAVLTVSADARSEFRLRGGEQTPELFLFEQITTPGASMDVNIVIEGANSREILIRAAGPSLSAFEIPNPLADPVIKIYSGTAQWFGNDNWGGTDTLIEAFNQIGAFPFTDSEAKDAAIRVSLPPGTYRLNVSDATGGTGFVLVQLYNLQ